MSPFCTSRGDKYWRYDDWTTRVDGSGKIEDDWPGVPNRLDGATTLDDGNQNLL